MTVTKVSFSCSVGGDGATGRVVEDIRWAVSAAGANNDSG
jgi:hypothetical protein